MQWRICPCPSRNNLCPPPFYPPAAMCSTHLCWSFECSVCQQGRAGYPTSAVYLSGVSMFVTSSAGTANVAPAKQALKLYLKAQSYLLIDNRIDKINLVLLHWCQRCLSLYVFKTMDKSTFFHNFLSFRRYLIESTILSFTNWKLERLFWMQHWWKKIEIFLETYVLVLSVRTQSPDFPGPCIDSIAVE